jgi:hypothetical protein
VASAVIPMTQSMGLRRPVNDIPAGRRRTALSTDAGGVRSARSRRATSVNSLGCQRSRLARSRTTEIPCLSGPNQSFEQCEYFANASAWVVLKANDQGLQAPPATQAGRCRFGR